jgi:hypothetical protein
VYDLDGIPAIAGCDLDTPAGVPGFERMSMEAVADDLPCSTDSIPCCRDLSPCSSDFFPCSDA